MGGLLRLRWMHYRGGARPRVVASRAQDDALIPCRMSGNGDVGKSRKEYLCGLYYKANVAAVNSFRPD